MNSIFDELGKSAKSKAQSAARGRSLPSPAQKSHAQHGKYTQSDAETADMFRRIEEMKRDLDHRIDEVYSKAAASKINPNLLMHSVSHQFADEIEKLKAAEKKLLEQFGQTPSPALPPQSKSSEKLTQERKGKTRGMRKWIPM